MFPQPGSGGWGNIGYVGGGAEGGLYVLAFFVVAIVLGALICNTTSRTTSWPRRETGLVRRRRRTIARKIHSISANRKAASPARAAGETSAMSAGMRRGVSTSLHLLSSRSSWSP